MSKLKFTLDRILQEANDDPEPMENNAFEDNNDEEHLVDVDKFQEMEPEDITSLEKEPSIPCIKFYESQLLESMFNKEKAFGTLLHNLSNDDPFMKFLLKIHDDSGYLIPFKLKRENEKELHLFITYYFYLLGCELVPEIEKAIILSIIEEEASWSPTIVDIVTMVNNLGFSITAFEDNELENCNTSNSALSSDFPSKSIEYVVRSLRMVFERNKIHTPDEIRYLVKLLVFVCLDINLKNNYDVHMIVQDCLGHLLEMYSEDDWNLNGKFHEVCECLANVRLHHHNQLAVCYMLPPTPRGIQLTKSLALLCLQYIMGLHDPIMCIDIVKPCDVLKVLKQINPRESCYILNTQFKLLELAISHNTFKRDIDKKIVKKLCRMFETITQEIPDNYEDNNFLFSKYSLASSLKYKLEHLCLL